MPQFLLLFRSSLDAMVLLLFPSLVPCPVQSVAHCWPLWDPQTSLGKAVPRAGGLLGKLVNKKEKRCLGPKDSTQMHENGWWCNDFKSWIKHRTKLLHTLWHLNEGSSRTGLEIIHLPKINVRHRTSFWGWKVFLFWAQ